MYSHALLNLKVQKLISAPTKVKLNTPQLTIAKLGRHQSRTQQVPGSIPTRVFRNAQEW